MNLFECIGGGSSELQETVLWTNSSPTSSFANQVVTLSDDIDNYDYIKFYFRATTSNSQSQNVMVPVSDFKNLNDTATSGTFLSLTSPNEYTGSYRMARRLAYVSATSARIQDSVRINSSGTDNSTVIPTAICGLKYASPKPSGTETVLWTNSSPSSDFAAQNAALSDSIANYRYIRLYYYLNKTSLTKEYDVIYTSEMAKLSVSGSSNSPRMVIGGQPSNAYYRFVDVTTNNNIYFNKCIQYSSTTTANSNMIPSRITGIS